MSENPCKVLVVDDNTDCANSTAFLLECMGHYRVRVAHSSDHAERVADEFQPDVVVLDVALPGKNGYQLAQDIRDRFPRTRFIVHSGYGSADYIHRSIAAGFEGHLVKPADPVALNGRVHHACQEAHNQHCPIDEN